MVTEWFDGRMYSALAKNGGWMKIEDLVQTTVDIEMAHGIYDVWWGSIVYDFFGKRGLRWCFTPSYERVEQAIGLHVLRGNFLVRDIEGVDQIAGIDGEPEKPRVEFKVRHTLPEMMDAIAKHHSPQGRRSRFRVVPPGSV